MHVEEDAETTVLYLQVGRHVRVFVLCKHLRACIYSEDCNKIQHTFKMNMETCCWLLTEQ